ncbi:hypothetical protein B0H34DRAFT_674955 [Crassisporium funariophilum]|nr:hypothetical protein B0H34DRAFT_674955 [Crassisporium funariophilum]
MSLHSPKRPLHLWAINAMIQESLNLLSTAWLSQRRAQKQEAVNFKEAAGWLGALLLQRKEGAHVRALVWLLPQAGFEDNLRGAGKYKAGVAYASSRKLEKSPWRASGFQRQSMWMGNKLDKTTKPGTAAGLSLPSPFRPPAEQCPAVESKLRACQKHNATSPQPAWRHLSWTSTPNLTWKATSKAPSLTASASALTMALP